MEKHMGTDDGTGGMQFSREEAHIFINGNSDEEAPENVLKGVMGEKRFNWCAFFFGFIYCLYRKCYNGALVYLALGAVDVAVSRLLFVKTNGLLAGNVVNLVYYVFCGFAFYPLYRKLIGDTVGKLSDTGNADDRNEALRSRGGTSARNMWLAILVFVVAYAVIFKTIYDLL